MKFKFIPELVKASGVQKGEMVLIHFWGEDQDKEIANQFLSAVTKLGATPVLLQQARSINHLIFGEVTEDCFDERYFEMFSNFDAVLDVFAYRPVVLGYELDSVQMGLYRRYVARLFCALMKAKRFIQIRIPTKANAEESGLSAEDYVRRMECAYNIDYEMLSLKCEQKIKQVEIYNQFVLHTGRNCELFFDLAGRKWHVDAGTGDWPCGEVYIAPNESKTRGAVFLNICLLKMLGSSIMLLYL